jgi:hypothetical protein
VSINEKIAHPLCHSPPDKLRGVTLKNILTNSASLILRYQTTSAMAPNISHAELENFNRAFKLRKNVPMPGTRDMSSWRAYIEGGERKFCDFEIALLVRFIKRMTGDNKKLVFPDRFKKDRQTTIYLWNQYVAARQTPSQAAERLQSVRRYVATWGAASLEAARKQLHEKLESDPKIIAQIREKRKAIEAKKDIDYSKHRYFRATVYKEGPIRHQRKGKLSLTRIQVKKTPSKLRTRLHVADLMKMDDSPVSSLFLLKVAKPNPNGMHLRRDPNIGKHMVKRGRESSLRQSISCRELSVMERDIEDLHRQLLEEVENLKQQIEELKKRNYVRCPRQKLFRCPPLSSHKPDGR